MKKNAVVYLRWLLIPLAVLLPILALLSLYFGTIEGDLVRIGRWSERDFGWHQTQATHQRAANGRAVTMPEVLVLGDSFSRPHIWQAYTGRVTQSYDYSHSSCIDYWLKWAAQRPYASARVVIVQSVERDLVGRFAKLEPCPARRAPFTLESQAASIPAQARSTTPAWPPTLDAAYLLKTAVNTVRLHTSTRDLASEDTRVVHLTGLPLFSSKQSNALLYLAGDDRKQAWNDQDIAAVASNLRHIQMQLAQAGLKFLFVPVPDKSTVYRPYFAQQPAPMPDLFAALAQSGVEFVDLQQAFRQALPATKDLYLPNDTHLGIVGYQLMGRAVAQKMQTLDVLH